MPRWAIFVVRMRAGAALAIFGFQPYVGLSAQLSASAQFPDQRNYAGVAGGTANSIQITIPNYTQHLVGVPLRFKANVDRGPGGTTLAVSGLPPVAVQKQTDAGLAALSGGEIKSGQIYTVVYDDVHQLIGGGLPVNAQVVPKTGAYVATAADCGKTLSLGGNAFYTFTISFSPVPAECAITILNADAGRGKGISISAITPFPLWPKQAVVALNEGGTWRLIPDKQLWHAAPTMYVNASQGSDNPLVSDCLVSLAPSGTCATFNHAIALIKRDVYATSPPTVQADCEGPYNQHVNVTGFAANLPGFNIIGNSSDPTLCSFAPTTGGNLINVQDYATVVFSGFTMNYPAASGGCTIFARQHVIIDIVNVVFLNNALGSHICSSDLSSVNVGPNITVQGNAGTFLGTVGKGILKFEGVVTIEGGVFSTFISVDDGEVKGTPNYVNAGSISGAQFDCSNNGVIALGSPYPPGLSPGTSATGCQHLP
jgi:hypothetical protein